jgi:hypothetical protein
MRTSGQRIDAHAANYAATTVGLKVSAQLAAMKAGFAAAAGSLAQVETKIQALCNHDDIKPIQIPFYLNFGRELWGMKRRGISGPALLGRGTECHARYVSYGLATALVKRIALDVFNLSIP